ncbi:hypothetical protein WA158_003080 [Blastocystis sp. Blastoise]
MPFMNSDNCETNVRQKWRCCLILSFVTLSEVNSTWLQLPNIETITYGTIFIYRKTSRSPRRPFEAERIDQELRICGEYGLRCKREIWRVQLVLAKMPARELLTLPEKDPRRLFQGAALIRRLTRAGLLNEEEKKLDDVLRLTTQKLMDRRLQSVVFRSGLAKSIHHARVLIRQRHIRVGRQLVNSPSFLVHKESEKQISFAQNSPFGNGRPGCYIYI